MMRFLVVGCGGSGGHTLAYLMDQLRSDLAKDGVDRLPAGWQFLFFDVPTAIQKGPEGVGNVEQQRGTYHGLGPRGGSYPALDYVLSERLRHDQGGGVDGLGQFGTWACQRPDEEETAVDLGAGQFRAIGRTVLLSKAGEVRDLLDATWKTLEHTETHDEMERVSWSTGSRYDRRAPALVLVVSSMAGGAGASMALDVCRLLSMVPNTNPSKVAVFMVSPGRVRHAARPGAHRRTGQRARHARRDRRQPDGCRAAPRHRAAPVARRHATPSATMSRSPASFPSVGPSAPSARSSARERRTRSIADSPAAWPA